RTSRSSLAPTDTFPRRHIGPDEAEVTEMLALLGYASLEELVAATIPEGIRLRRRLRLPEARGEHEMLEELRGMAARNEVFRSFLGMGYSDCITPPVILRNVLENPGWSTQYPTTDGRVEDYAGLAEGVHAGGALLVVAADLLALTLLRPPGEFGADICVGSSQRFGVPMGFGGPHAAFLSTRDEHKRQMPGRL